MLRDGPMRCFALATVLVLTACPPSLRRPESSQLVLTGTVYAGGFERRGEPLTEARLTLRRADTGEELASNFSSNAGGYRFAVTVTAGTRVVLIAEAPGFAPFAKAFVTGPFTEVTTSLSLEPLTTLDCVDTGCAAPAVELEWTAPPPGASGAVAAFETELDSPVQVDVDAERPVVLAMGYAQLDGGVDGTLALRIPLSRWSGLSDATAGTGVLEVAAATFDPQLAKWTRLPPVALQSESGLPIPEAALPSLQRAEFAGGAVAQFPFVGDHFVAVLGVRAPEGCLTGTIAAEGKPAQGATIALPGTEPVAADDQGAFCVSAATDDAPISIGGQYAGLPYAFAAVPRPTATGRCGGECRQVGELSVLPDALQLPAMCRFTGKVIDSQGNAVSSAEVIGFDDSIAGNSLTAFCGKTGTRCSLASPSGADGSFALDVPLLSSVLVAAQVSASTTAGDVQRRGGQRFSTCPTEPLTLKLQRGEDRVEISPSFVGSAIAWQPPRAAARVTVLDGAGLPKWGLAAPGGLTPPLTFALVPADATQTVAPIGVPASGDSVVVEFDGMGRDGVVYLGVGEASRP